MEFSLRKSCDSCANFSEAGYRAPEKEPDVDPEEKLPLMDGVGNSGGS